MRHSFAVRLCTSDVFYLVCCGGIAMATCRFLKHELKYKTKVMRSCVLQNTDLKLAAFKVVYSFDQITKKN